MTDTSQRDHASRLLKEACLSLRNAPSPHVANPPNCQHRASVALILRIRPCFGIPAEYDPSLSVSTPECIDRFFAQAWVQQGTPELLYIRRVARSGDRWSGQVAFPGGKRDPSDQSDLEVSVRETLEEISLSLRERHCLFIGNLPERIINTAWGKKPFMVLCPFVFLLLRFDIPPLSLQPSEVACAHWVPLSNLTNKSSSTSETTRLNSRSDAYGSRQGVFSKTLMQFWHGDLVFDAVRLTPSESLKSVRTLDTSGSESLPALKSMSFRNVRRSAQCAMTAEPPLNLWGLTLGMTEDLLKWLHPQAAENETWPHFTHWDKRVILWVLTFSLRRKRHLAAGVRRRYSCDCRKIAGFDATTYAVVGQHTQHCNRLQDTDLLNAYLEKMKLTLDVSTVVRAGLSALIILLLSFRRRSRLREAQ